MDSEKLHRLKRRFEKAMRKGKGLRLSADDVMQLVTWWIIRDQEEVEFNPLEPDCDEALRIAPTIDTERPHIRWMIRRDMPEVMAIESASFEFPWTEKDFIECLRRRNCIGMVVEENDRLTGFMLYELHSDRLNLLNLAVCPAARRGRVGTIMVNKLKGKLRERRRTHIEILIRESNLDGLRFFADQGFIAVGGVVRGHYTETNDDAIRMTTTYADVKQEQEDATEQSKK